MDQGQAAVIAAAVTAVVAFTSHVISLRSARRQAETAAREARAQAEESAIGAERSAREQREFYERQVDKILHFVSKRDSAGAGPSGDDQASHEPMALQILSAYRTWLDDLTSWLAQPSTQGLWDQRLTLTLRLRRVTSGLRIPNDYVPLYVDEDDRGFRTEYRVSSTTIEELEWMVTSLRADGDPEWTSRYILNTARALDQYLTVEARKELGTLGVEAEVAEVNRHET